MIKSLYKIGLVILFFLFVFGVPNPKPALAGCTHGPSFFCYYGDTIQLSQTISTACGTDLCHTWYDGAGNPYSSGYAFYNCNSAGCYYHYYSCDYGCVGGCVPSWGDCSVSCGGGTQSDGCGHTQSCNTQACSSCSDSCSGYQLIDHDSNCTNDSGCGTSATRYTGGACTVCSFNNSSCTNNFKNVVDSDCYVVGGMYTPENATVTIKKKVTLTSGSSLIIKKGGKISLEGGSIEIDGGYILMEQ